MAARFLIRQKLTNAGRVACTLRLVLNMPSGSLKRTHSQYLALQARLGVGLKTGVFFFASKKETKIF
jgi:hypothetical protein